MAERVEALLGSEGGVLVALGVAGEGGGPYPVAAGPRLDRVGPGLVRGGPALVHVVARAGQVGLGAVGVLSRVARLGGQRPLLASQRALARGFGKLGVQLAVGVVLGGERGGLLLVRAGALACGVGALLRSLA